MNFCLRNNPARLLAAAGGGKGRGTEDGRERRRVDFISEILAVGIQ